MILQLFAYCIICCKGFLAAACRITIARWWSLHSRSSLLQHSNLWRQDPMVAPLKSLASNISLIWYGGWTAVWKTPSGAQVCHHHQISLRCRCPSLVLDIAKWLGLGTGGEQAKLVHAQVLGGGADVCQKRDPTLQLELQVQVLQPPGNVASRRL